MRTKKECQKILFDLGIRLGLSPRLMSDHLLDDNDKIDMMSGVLSIEALQSSIELFKLHTLPALLQEQEDKLKTEYRCQNPQAPTQHWSERPYRLPFVRQSREKGD